MLEGLVSRIDEALERLPKTGYRASIIYGAAYRFRELVANFEALVSKAKCLAESRGSCSKTSEGLLCNTGCASTMLLESGSEVKVWRYRTGLSAVYDGKALRVTTKRYVVEALGAKARLLYRHGGGVLEVDLKDERLLYKVNREISRVLGEVNLELRKATENIVKCARSQAIVC